MTAKINWIASVAMLFVMALFGLWLNSRWVALQADQQASDQHIYEIVLKFVSESKIRAAIQVDKNGTVLWCNDVTTALFPIQVGESIETLMPEEQQKQHRSGFISAMALNQPGRVLTDLTCDAETYDGFRKVHIQTWSTPKGAMAFLRVLEDE